MTRSMLSEKKAGRPGLPRRRLALLAVLAVVAIFAVVAQMTGLFEPSGATVLNRSGSELQDVRLLLRDAEGTLLADEKRAVLANGQKFSVTEKLSDVHLLLTFSLHGQLGRYQQPKIDLRRGRVLEIAPDGTVRNANEVLSPR